jgi:hypothetical protein
MPLRDESFRGNDTVLQNLIGGPSECTFDYTLPYLYPDVAGDHFRAIIGPDTAVTPAATTLSSTAAAGATSISTAATIAAGSSISIGGTTTEYAYTGAPTGAGPYTIPLLIAPGSTTPYTLLASHASAAAVVVATTHTFKNNNRAAAFPTYSLTHNNGSEIRGYPSCLLDEFLVKVDGKGAVSADAKWKGFPSAVQAGGTFSYSTVQGQPGWGTTTTLNGVASTRTMTADLTFKRAAEAVHSADGTQGPREMFPDSLDFTYKIKAIFENTTDSAAFLAYNSLPVVFQIMQPAALGAGLITVTTTTGKHTKFAGDFTGKYILADLEGSGIYNTTDASAAQVAVTNFVSATY